MLLGYLYDLVDDELPICDQLARIDSLPDDAQHVDVCERLQVLLMLNLNQPVEEPLEVHLALQHRRES